MSSNSFKYRARQPGGYVQIEDYSIIGNMHTAALISRDSSIDSFCYPDFDSPSIFVRILDKDIGGHWSINPQEESVIKQYYLPSSAVLSTKYLQDDGVATVNDFMPRPRPSLRSQHPLYPWLVRRVEGARGRVNMNMECFPAFDYARDSHTTEIYPFESPFRRKKKGVDFSLQPANANNPSSEPSSTMIWPRVVFSSPQLNLELVAVFTRGDDGTFPEITFVEENTTYPRALGSGVTCKFSLVETQTVTFILRPLVESNRTSGVPSPASSVEDLTTLADIVLDPQVSNYSNPRLTSDFAQGLFDDTLSYWRNWVSHCSYKGRWREFVLKSAIALKLLTYEPTGAIVAAATFSLPEVIGGSRNWDYRYTWVRDSSFCIYALLRIGFKAEADAYMNFMHCRIKHPENAKQPLQIMYTIHGDTEMPEIELTHLNGYKGSKPVRIGNGAADHLQLDIYGELLDSIYLHQKYSRPMSYDVWALVRKLVDFSCDNIYTPDNSIWEVRSSRQNFLYSKVMLWVAIDRGLRLAEKRSFPLLQRQKWLNARDSLYEEIQNQGWNHEESFYCSSYESKDLLDSSILIMPMVLFTSAVDPRFISTLDRILRAPEKGGLTINKLVFRYNSTLSHDGIEGPGEEGSFTMCSLWAVEALTRAGIYEPKYLLEAVHMFEELIAFANHNGLYSEEISRSGEALGNTPQAFTHVSMISAAFNLDRALSNNQPV